MRFSTDCEAESDWLLDTLRTSFADDEPRAESGDGREINDAETTAGQAAWTPVNGDLANAADLPERIANYRILERIGQGGMGVVYRAYDERLQREVALKARPCDNEDPAREIRFGSEAMAAAKLDHPHIVPIYEAGEATGYQYIAMKYVSGESLAERPPLPPRIAAAALRDAAVAVHFAHQHRVLHRDIKPANLLIDESGWLYVTDFGLAKHLDAANDQTLVGTILGTPSYMSPEQAAGLNDEVTTAADIYGLGGVLYYQLTGRPPFAAATTLETCRQVVDQQVTPPGQIRPDIDHDLETVCLKCMAKRPADRYDSAAQVADDLRRWLEHRPIHARPISPVERLQRWCRRRPTLAGLGTLLILMTAVIAVGSPLAIWSLNAEKNLATQQTELAEARAEQACRNLIAASLAHARARAEGALVSTEKTLSRIAAKCSRCGPERAD